jgi:hypothetical protein
MIRSLAILALSLAFVGTCWGQPQVRAAGNMLRWTAPVVRTDGTAYSMEEEGSHYSLYWARGNQSGAITVDKTATTFDISEFRAGSTFYLTACDDQEPTVCSASSNTVKKSGGPPAAPAIELDGLQATGETSSSEESPE